MNRITPRPIEMEKLRATAPGGPILVVNLIKLHPGAEALDFYLGYRRAAAAGGPGKVEVLHAGPAFADVCDDGESWDYVVITRYPDFDAFAQTISTAHYQDTAASFRPRAIERTIMLVTGAGAPLERPSEPPPKSPIPSLLP